MTADALEFSERRQPAYIRSFALAAAVHIGLAAIMMVAVHFKMSPPESVVVELWEPPPSPPPPATAHPPVPHKSRKTASAPPPDRAAPQFSPPTAPR